MKLIKTVNPLVDRRVAKTLKPRNPVLAALKANLGARGGAHGKTRGAVRRAEKMALLKEIGVRD